VLAVAVVGTISLQMVFLQWYIEDAAISFAYARHLASGEGLVAYPGGERVEGYSNPLWVFLLTGWQLLGVNGFVSSKILGAVLGGASVLLTWAITRDLREEDDAVPLFAALVLAVNPQFVIWNAGGLENSLFSFLLALGIWRALAEAREGGWPWSALAFFALAITRPEGILYAAAAGFWAMVYALAAGRGVVPTLQWLLTFFVPMGRSAYDPLNWSFKGWRYLQNYAHELWHGYLLPVYLLGMTGLRGRRAWLGLLPLVAVAAALLYPGPEILADLAVWPDFHPPQWWSRVRIWILVAVAIATPMIAVGRPGWYGRVLCWSVAAAGLYFSVRAGGDWMRGFRWLSLIAVPLAVLFAVGVGDIADALSRLALRRSEKHATGADAPARRWPGRWLHHEWGLSAGLVAIVLFALPFPPAINHLVWYQHKPETSPARIHNRVKYMRWVQRRLHLDHVVNLDVDMGGTMYWSGHEIVDIAGLVDVPMGHHDYEKPFIREYIFEERKPHFAHLHGGWERKTGVKGHPEYKRDYLELPGYPTGKTSLHLGNRIRRDLLVTHDWEGSPERVVFFADEIVLEGFEVPLGEGVAGGHFYLELAMRAGPLSPPDDFRVIVFIADGEALQSWSVPPGYDWYFPHEWQRGEVVFGRFSVQLPSDLPAGTYDLGLLVLNGEGAVLSPEVVPAAAVVGGREGTEPRFALGEVRWPAQFEVLSRKAFEAALALDISTFEGDAAALRCEAAEQGWERLRQRRPRDYRWQKQVRPMVARTLSTCWLDRARGDADREDMVEHLARARWWDHWTPGLRKTARPVADALHAEGMDARSRRDWETAYRRFSDVLRIDATRSFSRRYAEEARDYRLSLDPESLARAAEEEEERRRAREERRRKLMPDDQGKTPPPAPPDAEGKTP
jgi:hypothetical protein